MNENAAGTAKGLPKLSKKVKIGWILAVVLFVVVMLIPTTEIFTAQIRLSIAVTAAIMCGFAFEILPNVILGIALLTIYIVIGLADASTALSGFTNENVWASAAAMLLVGVMDQTRVLKKACYGAMLKLGGSLRAIVIAMAIVSIALGAVIGGANVAAPMIVIAYALCVALGLEPGSNEAALLMVSSYVAANAPTAYFYSSLQAMGFSAVQNVVSDVTPITYSSYLVQNWPMILFGFITILVCILLFPVGGKKKEKKSREDVKAASRQYLTGELEKVGKMQGATNTCVLPYEIAMPMLMFSYGMVNMKQFVKAMGLTETGAAA